MKSETSLLYDPDGWRLVGSSRHNDGSKKYDSPLHLCNDRDEQG